MISQAKNSSLKKLKPEKLNVRRQLKQSLLSRMKLKPHQQRQKMRKAKNRPQSKFPLLITQLMTLRLQLISQIMGPQYSVVLKLKELNKSREKQHLALWMVTILKCPSMSE